MKKDHKSGSVSAPDESDETGSFIPGYLSYLLAHASFLFSGQFHARLRERGVPVATWRVLATLSDGDGMTVGELARIALANQPTMTKNIDKLEKAGLIERRGDDGDRRKTLVFITSSGWELIKDLLAEAKAHERKVTEAYTDEEILVLKRVLGTLISRLEAQ